MRLAGLLFLSVLIIGCKHHVKEEKREHLVINIQEFAEKKIELRNNLGELTVTLPIWFDTLFWSDGKSAWPSFDTCTEQECFVCGNKRIGVDYGNCIQIPPIYNFSVCFLKRISCEQIVNRRDSIFQAFQRKHSKNPESLNEPKELKTINGRKFLVSSSNDRKKHAAELYAETIVKGQKLMLRFYSCATDCETFIKKMEPCFMSIKIK